MKNICVPSGYSGDSFCEIEISGKNDHISQEAISAIEDFCHEAVCGGTELVAKKRYNVTEWEDRTNDCAEYHCLCEEERCITWSLCNSSKDTKKMCLDKKCIPSDEVMMEECFIVDVQFNDISTLFEVTNMTSTVVEKNDIEIDTSKVGIERDEKGRVVRVVVFLDDRGNAYDIADTMNECSSSPSSSSSSSKSYSSPSP